LSLQIIRIISYNWLMVSLDGQWESDVIILRNS
jgi:hypothetical protein